MCSRWQVWATLKKKWCHHFCACDLMWIQEPPGGFSSQEKTVTLKKEPRLSLGITIAGGRDGRSRLPVYITSVQPVGCLHRDGTIKTGLNSVILLAYFTSSVSCLKCFCSCLPPPRWYIAEYKWYWPDPADLQWGSDNPKDPGGSEYRDTASHSDLLRWGRAGWRVQQQGRHGHAGRHQRGRH